MVEEDVVEEDEEKVADMVKGNSPVAMARTKQAIWRGADVGLTEAMQQAWQLIMAQNRHPDIEEGGRAYLERREPRWRPYGEHGE